MEATKNKVRFLPGASKFTGRSSLLRCAVAGTGIMLSSAAYSGATIEVGDGSINIGAGVRLGGTFVEDGSPDGDSWAKNFDVYNMRLYFGAKVNDIVKFTFNTEEIFSDGPVDILDAIAQFEFSPEFNVWVGRHLTPADRIEMNGPYYSLTWNQYTQPLYASDQGGAAGTYGRDDGVTVWGKSGKFIYAVGAFDGIEGFGNEEDNLLLAGRFAYNFLNMEDNPAYYTSSTYYGGLGNIFTVALSFQSQDSGTGSAVESGDFFGYTLDFLSETVLDEGAVLTFEGEYKDFDADFTPAMPAPGASFDLFDGDSWFLSAAYLFPKGDSYGQYQPYIRFVENNPSDADSSDLTEIGLNYVISGHNAKVTLNYSSGDANISGYPGADVDALTLGAQLQF